MGPLKVPSGPVRAVSGREHGLCSDGHDSNGREDPDLENAVRAMGRFDASKCHRHPQEMNQSSDRWGAVTAGNSVLFRVPRFAFPKVMEGLTCHGVSCEGYPGGSRWCLYHSVSLQWVIRF